MGMVRPALAHGYLLRAIPEDRAVLQRAPARLQYWFSEPMEPEFTTLIVRDQTGKTDRNGRCFTGQQYTGDSANAARYGRRRVYRGYAAGVRQ